MARIAGIELPNEKRIEISLTYIKGIGLTFARKILQTTAIKPDTRTKDLTEKQMMLISNTIDKNYKVEGEMVQEVKKNIRRLQDIKCYKGIRHKLGLPVRGQRTRNNAVTRKGKNIAVGGLNPKISKT